MKTLTKLTNLFTSLSNNTSSTNSALGQQLINDQHRYLIQKYFNNERSAQTTTVGGQSLTLTGSLSINATSATLSSSWIYPTVTQLVNFSGSQQRTVLFTNGSTAITWVGGLTATATTAISTVGVQYYNIPANISKIKDFTVSVGQLSYTPKEITTRAEWDLVNSLPYTSDIPNYFFIYNNQVGIFPTPSTTGNIITFNYKTRVADLTYADYTTGTIATMSGNSVTGTTTAWTSLFPTGTDLSFTNLAITVTPPGGDGIFYPISNFVSATSLVLVNPVVNTPSVSGASYIIGQLPLLSEDFHDMLVYGALVTYFSGIVNDDAKYKKFKALYDERLILLEEYAGTKTALSVDLGVEPSLTNPNLFYYGS